MQGKLPNSKMRASEKAWIALAVTMLAGLAASIVGAVVVLISGWVH